MSVESKQVLVGKNTAPLSKPTFGTQNRKRGLESSGFSDDQGKKKVARKNLPLEQFLLIEQMHVMNTNDVTILRQSADFNKVQLQYEFSNDCSNAACTCRVFINGKPIGEATSLTKTLAKSEASTNAVVSLRKMCWTVRVKQHADSDDTGVTKDELGGSDGGASVSQAIPDSNIGNKLLKMMGWSGGGVGKDGQGIAEPISVDVVVKREGLGLSRAKGVGKEFVSIIRATINDYIASDQQSDLVFSAEFTKEERAIIHSQAQKLGLKSHSHGTGDDRYLILSRKRSAGQLFDHIMQNSGSTSKYDLVPPTGF